MPPHGPACPPPNPEPRRPELAVPTGACDAHCHIYGPFACYPLPDDRSFTPSEAPEPALRRLHDHLGIERAVIVQSQGHGWDHRPLLDALVHGAGRYRGVALVRPDTAEADIAALDAAGVCGARFSFLAHLGGGPDPAAIHAVADRVRTHCWHIAIHVAGDGLAEHEALIRALPGPVVIDHMGRPDLRAGLSSPAITALRRLLNTGRVWVKLSGADRISLTGAPFRDVVPLAAGLAAHAPERVLWGSDWPHVNLHGPMPNDGDLVDMLAEVVPSVAARNKLLVDNPVQFFGFEA